MENIDVSVFAEEISIGTDVNRETPKKRKRSYSRYEETRLRCKIRLANLANTFISLLESLSEKELFHISTSRRDEVDCGKKGRR